VPSFLPEATADTRGEDRFEKAVENETAQAEGVAYGLNKRSRPEAPPAGNADASADAPAPRERSFVERAMADKARAAANPTDADTQQFRDDLAHLPDSAPMAAYEDMPIEAFGEAMLRGMGWKEGAPVGRNSKEVVKPIEYIPRPERLGLGAAAAAAPPGGGAAGGRPLRPGESREGKVHMALPVGPDGRVRNVRTLDETLVVREAAGVRAGKRMVVAEGPHAGLACEVLSVQPPSGDGRSERATVRLERGGASVTLRSRHLAEVGSRDALRAEAAATGGGAPSDTKAKDRHAPVPAEAPRREDDAPPWLAPHIRVRCVSRRLGNGAHYLRKGTVVDVLAPGVCMLRLDADDSAGTSLLEDVPQRALETLVPKRAGRVTVVSGRHRGTRAKMLSRDADAGTAHVQLCTDFSMHTLPLDAIAEYVGPADEHD
jgi:G patch domain/KOW motif-containing protein